MYRTGDLVRQRPTGELEYLGRLDHQVKVRGFRIELQEIESVLATHPAVVECAVTVRRAASGDPRLVAYFTAAGTGVDPSDLRRFLEGQLPAHMIPFLFVPLAALPTTANGKVDRVALPNDPNSLRDAAESSSRPPHTDLERQIAAVWQELLGIDKVGVHDNFFDLGAHSLLMVRAADALRKAVGERLILLDLFRYPTVATLASFLDPQAARAPQLRQDGTARQRPSSADEREAIAIIGMKGRFPRARDLEQFWRNLRDGVETISFFSDEELLARGVSASLLCDPLYVKAGTMLEDADRFDAAFFGYSPREAEFMDPQHRLFLECASEVLEDAGYDPARYPGLIGVFAGVSANRYWLNLHSVSNLLDGDDGYLALIGNDKDFLPTRVSYKLDLKGPSVTVRTPWPTPR